MLDLPAFLAVTGPGLAQLPVIVYFRDLDSSMMNIASALAARSVLFSSAFHRGEFFATVRELLASLPDAALAWAVRELEGKSRVLPPGCDLRRLDLDRQRGLADAASGRWGDPGLGPLVVWNPTWEDDESPREVFAVLMDLKAEGVPFRLAVAGGNDSAPPAESSRAREELGDRVVQWEPVPDRQEYASLLWAADVVVSAARHDYSGAGVVEALYCGCRPVLPHRLSYPEIIPTDAHERVLYREGELASALRSALARPREWSEDWQRTWVARYDWASMAARYDEEIRRCWKTAREEW
jgi:glycosyltransferase involved in cell wall biosynthesis